MSGLHTRSPPAPPRDLVVRLKPHFQRSLKVCACRALLRAAPSCWLSPLIPAPDLHVTPRVPQHKLQPVAASPWSRCQGTRAQLIPEEGGGGPTAQDLVQASSGGRETGPSLREGAQTLWEVGASRSQGPAWGAWGGLWLQEARAGAVPDRAPGRLFLPLSSNVQ